MLLCTRRKECPVRNRISLDDHFLSVEEYKFKFLVGTMQKIFGLSAFCVVIPLLGPFVPHLAFQNSSCSLHRKRNSGSLVM